MSDEQPVDADVYAANLERLDRIGREALAADPAEAIRLVREANALVAELLPMHRQLMDELATHRATLQAACDELAAEGAADDGVPTARDDLDALDGVGDGEGAPF